MEKLDTDVLIVGGGVGGSAAALAVTKLGKRAILTEETDWLGRKLTTQAVPPDEHYWVERFGCTCNYCEFRDLVRQFYKDHYLLTSVARSDPQLNPGKGSVSRLCHEPKIAVAVLDQMMAYLIASGKLQIKRYLKPVSVETHGDYISAVTFQHTCTNRIQTFTADYVLDVTELGDLLPLSGAEYVSGAELSGRWESHMRWKGLQIQKRYRLLLGVWRLATIVIGTVLSSNLTNILNGVVTYLNFPLRGLEEC